MIGRSFQEQIDLAYEELALIAKENPVIGSGKWSMQRRYIDGLEFARDELHFEERAVKALEDIADRLARNEDLMRKFITAVDGSMMFS